MPGVLDSDLVARELYTSHGYKEIDHVYVFHRELSDFESPMDRRQMQIRRQMVVEVTEEPPLQSWWEACTLGDFDLTRFELISRAGGPAAAVATFRSMEILGESTIGRAVGLIDFRVNEPLRRRGRATFLLSEAFRQFIRQGIMLVEGQAMQHNIAAIGALQKLGFQQVALGCVFRKDAGKR